MPIRDLVPDPPCVGCPLRSICDTHEMACREFASYVSQRRTGREDRVPSKVIYRRLYREAKDDDEENRQASLFE